LIIYLMIRRIGRENNENDLSKHDSTVLFFQQIVK